MARSIRIQSAGAYYHVMARGNRRETLFHDDDDRRFFLHTLSQACEMTGWRVQAWVLMSNHYHLFLQTPEPNLVAGMAWLQNTLTRRYNGEMGSGCEYLTIQWPPLGLRQKAPERCAVLPTMPVHLWFPPDYPMSFFVNILHPDPISPLTPGQYMTIAFDKEWGLPPGASSPTQRADVVQQFQQGVFLYGGATAEDHPSDAVGALAGASGPGWKSAVVKILTACGADNITKDVHDAFTKKFGNLEKFVHQMPKNISSFPVLIDAKLRSVGRCCSDRKPQESDLDYFKRSGLVVIPSPIIQVGRGFAPSGAGQIDWQN
jgi:REP element-mobilizing transposase RayT